MRGVGFNDLEMFLTIKITRTTITRKFILEA